MPVLKYKYTGEIDEHKERVKSKGFPYVNKIKLDPHGVLNPHAHNSSNTHLIVQGEMTVFYTKEADMKEGPVLGTYKAGESAEIEANRCYRAVAGAKGCIFVEGHKDLSPTSAERFERFGAMIQTPTGDMKHNGKDQINCSRGRCRWVDNKTYHMCAEFGDKDSAKRLCDAKE